MFLHGSLPDAIPQLQTRQALLILDLQNDFVSMNSKIPVNAPSHFLDRIKQLVPAFRDVGDVIWVRTEFEALRKVNDPEGEGESLITDQQLPEELRGRKIETGTASKAFPITQATSQRALSLFERAAARAQSGGGGGGGGSREASIEVEDESECFLSLSDTGKQPTCCRPNTFGSKFAFDDTSLINESTDSILIKSHYSAFNDTSLVTSLRGSLVTDLFICGVLSNISVYATAVDAAKYGFSITLIDDCLGYRSRARHEEAMRLMTDYMGADIVSYQDLMQTIRKKVPHAEASTTADSSASHVDARTPGPDQRSHGSVRAAPTVHDSSSVTRSIDSGVADVVARRSVSPEQDGSQSRAGERHRKVGEDEEGARHVDKRPRSGEHTPSIKSLAETSAVEGSEKISATSDDDQARSQPIEVSGAEEDDTKHDDQATEIPSKDDLYKSIAALTRSKRSTSPVALGERSPPPQSARVESKTKIRVRKVSSKQAIPKSNPPMKKITPDETIGEGDSRVVRDLWPSVLKDDIFDKVKKEVRWQKMFHRGGEVPRLVAVEGDTNEDGSFPIYRHPADESPPLLPFTPFVAAIRDAVQNQLHHQMNHVLIQFYRSGQDYISEHSDKTLDIIRGSNIVNVSLGAERVMTLRTKRSDPQPPTENDDVSPSSEPPKTDASADASATRRIQRIPLPHNSMFVLGPKTNERWLHGIRQDKRPDALRSEEELAYNGERISLTFRHIGTFLDQDSKTIWGQGATSKVESEARKVINGDTPEAEAMIKAFGSENQQSEFDWSAHYGRGFDVLDTVETSETTKLPKDPKPQLHLSGDDISDIQVRLLLSEANIQCEIVARPNTSKAPRDERALSFVDNDRDATVVKGGIPTLVYIETYYRQNGAFGSLHTRHETGTVISRIGQWRALYVLWKQMGPDESGAKVFRDQLATWEEHASEHKFIGGPTFSMADCAFWPLLDGIITEWDAWDAAEFPHLAKYQELVGARPAIQAVVGVGKDKSPVIGKQGGGRSDEKKATSAERG